jgi:hypothetical protein
MVEKWVVLNNSGKILNLPKSKIVLKKKNQSIDLVAATGKPIFQLELDPEIKLHFAYNNLKTVEKVSREQSHDVKGLSDKMDALLDVITGKDDSNVTDKIDSLVEALKGNQNANIDVEQLASLLAATGVVSKKDKESMTPDEQEENKMRDEAMEKLMSSTKDPEKSMSTFGRTKVISENNDDMSDLIDF